MIYPIGGINIQLQKAANGWIVQIPITYEHEPMIDWSDPAYVKKVVGVMKEEYAKDPELEALGHYDNGAPGAVPVMGSIKVPEPQNPVYIFSSFDAAVAFIKERYDN